MHNRSRQKRKEAVQPGELGGRTHHPASVEVIAVTYRMTTLATFLGLEEPPALPKAMPRPRVDPPAESVAVLSDDDEAEEAVVDVGPHPPPYPPPSTRAITDDHIGRSRSKFVARPPRRLRTPSRSPRSRRAVEEDDEDEYWGSWGPTGASRSDG